MTNAELKQKIRAIKADRLRSIVDTVQDSSALERSCYHDLRLEEVELLTGLKAPESPWAERLAEYYRWREKTEAIVVNGCPETISEFVRAANNVYDNRHDDRYEEFRYKPYGEFVSYYGEKSDDFS